MSKQRLNSKSSTTPQQADLVSVPAPTEAPVPIASSTAMPLNHNPIQDLSDKIEKLVGLFENFESEDRLWVDAKHAVQAFDVPIKTIKTWAANGFVRKAKLGPNFQSKTLYSAEDINDVLCRTALGKSPKNALQKASP